MRLLVSLPPERVGLFRFLLEASDNLASFTVLDRREALLKVLFSPHQEREVLRTLEGIGETVPLVVRPWPVAAETAPKPDTRDTLPERPGTGACPDPCLSDAPTDRLHEENTCADTPGTAGNFPASSLPPEA